MLQKREGKSIVPYGVFPEKHEYETAAVFLKLGFDVEFIRPRNSKRATSPDVVIDGVEWEIKSPTGRSRYTIQNQFRRAARQSHNLIFDSRRIQFSGDFVRQEVEKQFALRRSIHKLKFITKNGRVIDFQK